MEEILKRVEADVNGVFAGHTALQAASQNGHLEVIKILLRHKADVEIEVVPFQLILFIAYDTFNYRDVRNKILKKNNCKNNCNIS